MKLKKIRVLSLGKILGIIFSFFGLIVGIIVAISSLQLRIASKSVENGVILAGLPTGLELISMIAFPLFYGLIGFLAGILIAFIYNLVARIFGGLEIEVE
jgi:hypothetical protein